jgi:hypothetical protein
MTSTSVPSPVTVSTRTELHLPWIVTLGIGFWFLAAMMVRWFGPTVFVPGSVLLPLTFALTVPIAGAFLWLGILLSRARGAATFPAAVVMTSVAMLLDGIALTFLPSLYGPSYAIGGAWILWGAGLIQTFAFIRTQRGT